MVLKKVTILAFLLCLSGFSLFASERGSDIADTYGDDYITMPINISFVHGFSIGESLAKGGKIINKFSLNVLTGRAVKLHGIEFGGVWNDYSEGIHGGQFAGVFNTVGDNSTGAQFAGVLNIVAGSFRGIQSSGVANIVDGRVNGFQAAGVANLANGGTEGFLAAGAANLVSGSAKGVQAAGAVNIITGDLNGAQLAGALNIVESDVDGLQAAGAANLAHGSYHGVQIAGALNIVDDTFNGLQISGFINIADQFESGVQLGVINIAREQRGLPIGVITFAQNNQYARLQLEGTEIANPGIAFKFGVPYFYNIYSMLNLPDDKNRWAYGFGFGSEKILSHMLSLNIEIMAHQELWLHEERVTTLLHTDRLNLLNQLKITFGLQVSRHLTLFAGPTLNALVENPDADALGASLAPSWTFYEKELDTCRGTMLKMWLGFSAGVRF